ncbi:amidohydrolase family protein [Piscinibacter sp.]|uniref:amidohydrolase family protein n=1 Tax=Piscinibacter sp. TaxID=1903157 RepID=UPI002C42D23D|nr:amidohydrolase family protein [Albitalea sp.]HUG23951.1 amidohydrolase family protein [Albitalea sp.]
MTSPTDPDLRRLPIKLDSTSNGEFAPVALDAAARHARALARGAVDAAARRTGQDRRRYLVSLLGAAATLSALDRAFAAAGKRGGGYMLPAEAPFELAAAQAALAGDEFIFDVQLHHVNPQGAWRKNAGPNAFKGMPNSDCGKPDHVECFSSGALLKDVFLDSDTAMGVLSHVPGGADTNPLDFEAAGATREAARALDGTERLLLHGRCMPTLPGELDGMDAQAARHKLAAFKTYTQFGPRDGDSGFFLDDERHGTPFIERARKLGVRNIAVHKGLAFGPRGYEFSTARDIGPAAKRHPDMGFLVYHAGFDTGVKEGPYDPRAEAGVDVLIRSVIEAGHPRNVYAELGSTWRFVMRDPDQAAHLMGKLLKTFGEDHILWGTDSIWYGSPQDQIQAFRAFDIRPEFQQKYGYPAITPAIKRKIFGLNAARVYGLKPDEMRKKLVKDPVQKRKAEYANDPQPSFATYGPRTRSEFLAFRRIQGELP